MFMVGRVCWCGAMDGSNVTAQLYHGLFVGKIVCEGCCLGVFIFDL